MTSIEAKNALHKAIRPVAYIVYTETKAHKTEHELEIGRGARKKAEAIKNSNDAELIGRGVCRYEAATDTAFFSVKKAAAGANSYITTICKPGFTAVVFKVGEDAKADLDAEDRSESSSSEDSGQPLPTRANMPDLPPVPPPRGATAQQPTPPTQTVTPQQPTQPGGMPQRPPLQRRDAFSWMPPQPTQTTTPQQPMPPRPATIPQNPTQPMPPRQTPMPQVPPLPTRPNNPQQPPRPAPMQRQGAPTANVPPPPQRPAPPAQNAPPPAPTLPGPNRLPAIPNAAPAPKLSQKYPLDALQAIRKQTDRGLPAGMGDFKGVFKGVLEMQKAEAAPTNDPAAVAERIKQYDNLIGTILTYTDKFEADDSNTAKKGQFGFTKRKRTNLDGVRQVKLDFSQSVLEDAMRARSELLKPPVLATLQGLARKESAGGGLSEQGTAAYHEARAQLLVLDAGGMPDVASGGTSTVNLLKNTDGSIAYAFKSIEGESSVTGFDKGVGTAHEILTSRALGVVEKHSGLSFGFPTTTYATLPVGLGPARGGALIEGINGPDLEDPNQAKLKRDNPNPTPTEFAALQQKRGALWDPNADDLYVTNLYRQKRAEQADRAAQVPVDRGQVILLSALFSGGMMDAKWQNVMLDPVKGARPTDGGAAMASQEELLDFIWSDKQPDGRIKVQSPNFGMGMLGLPGGGEHAMATAPLPQGLMDQVSGMDVDAIEREMMDAVNDIQGLDRALQGKVGESNVKAAISSIRCAQAAMSRNYPGGQPTTEEFLLAYNEEMVSWLEDLLNNPANR